MTPTPTPINLRQLNIYQLPPTLLNSLTVRSIQSEPTDEPAKEPTIDPPAALGSLQCQACPDATFQSVEEQREHFKSDWHRYNVKARIIGRAVPADEWEGMIEGALRESFEILTTRRILYIRLCIILVGVIIRRRQSDQTAETIETPTGR